MDGLKLLGLEDGDPLTWRLELNGSVIRFHRPETYPLEPPSVTMHVGESNERTALLPDLIAESDPNGKAARAWSPLFGDDITGLMRTLASLPDEPCATSEEPSPRTLLAMKRGAALNPHPH